MKRPVSIAAAAVVVLVVALLAMGASDAKRGGDDPIAQLRQRVRALERRVEVLEKRVHGESVKVRSATRRSSRPSARRTRR